MLKKILLTVLVLILLLLGIGFLLPVDSDVERSVVIDAPASTIYPTLATLRTWPEWTAWSSEQDPDCEWSFEGPETGAGAVMKWEGRRHMKGTLTIDKADPLTGIQYTLAMEDMDPMKGSVTLAAEGSGTKVTWCFHGKLNGMPWSNWMQMVLIDPMVGHAFEVGLRNLKTRSEGGKAVEASADKGKRDKEK